MANRIYSSWLLDNHQVFIQVPDDKAIRMGHARQRLGVFQKNDDLVLFQSTSIVRTNGIADFHPSRSDQFPDIAPGGTAHAGSQHFGKRMTGLLRRDSEGGYGSHKTTFVRRT